MSTPSATTSTGTGRPRDPRIDGAVLQATTELLEEVGYLQLTIAAIAERAGTNKPAIYRRWPTKAHLVHEAVFPTQTAPLRFDGVIPPGGDLRSDIRALVSTGLELLGRPAARAALPGLLAEVTADPALHAEVLDHFTGATWAWMQHRLEDSIARGEVRADVQPATVLELIAGSTFIAIAMQPRDQIDSAWADDVADLIMRGIAA